MRYILKLSFFIGLMMMVSVATGLAETMFIKKDRVKVTAQKSPLSKVVASLNRGDAVEVLKKSGRHYKVRVRSGKVGWVFKFKLSAKRPTKGRGGSGALSLLTGESVISAREARSGGSIRGLKEVSETYTKNKNIDPAHKISVERMEKLSISEKDLARFQQEGSVGEFAGGGQ